MRRSVRPSRWYASFAANTSCNAAYGHGVAVARLGKRPLPPPQHLHRHHQCRAISSCGPRLGRSEVARPVAEPSKRPKRRLWRGTFALVAVASVGTLVAFSLGEAGAPGGGPSASPSAVPGALNQERFVPFEVVARDDVSPNAFVLTLRLPSTSTTAAAEATRAAVARARRHGLWSVEVRQPQLQIARDYTPLPTTAVEQADSADGADDDCIRLFVRTVPGGEVSHYLARQRVGATVDLRGPRLSFDLGARVGPGDAARRVVVLTGGTGIATALQAADAVLGQRRAGTTVAILWANRLPDDSAGLEDEDGRRPPSSASNPIVRDLCALQQRHGADRVRLQCFVDAERTFVTDAVVRASMQDQGLASSRWPSFWRAVWPWRSEPRATAREGAEPAATRDQDSRPCRYHAAAVLEGLEADPPRDAAHADCSCSAAEDAPPGKNLVLVSGPDGFIAALAGPKTWARGKERQGPVGGVLGRIRADNPQAFEQWQVLKL